jgi:hypothetical protein
MQNTSHAVMAQRSEARDSLDDFPTPPWATRALIEYIIKRKSGLKKQCCLEPACGVGHMSKVLAEYFGEVRSSDIAAYGYGDVRDYTTYPYETGVVDWVITNPPFKLAEEFIVKSLNVARCGVAMLVRTVFIESVGRHERLFRDRPPSLFAQFTERVPMVKGRLDKKASTATGYGWIVWDKQLSNNVPQLVWIPACRKALEHATDYNMPHVKKQQASNNQLKNAGQKPDERNAKTSKALHARRRSKNNSGHNDLFREINDDNVDSKTRCGY